MSTRSKLALLRVAEEVGTGAADKLGVDLWRGYVMSAPRSKNMTLGAALTALRRPDAKLVRLHGNNGGAAILRLAVRRSRSR